jgi:Uma2 family endonuclease
MASTYTKGTSIPYVPTDAANLYPETDGKPMAASDYHRRLLMWTLQALEAHFAQNPEVYISGDIMMYYREGDPRKSISPDVLVCFGINPKLRLTYKTWEEGKAPDFVMEFSSKSTYDKDLGEKMDVYASLGIQDYFLYDAEGLYLPSPLMGFTLVDGVYVAIPPGERGGFRASVLDLDFHLRDGEIAIYDPVAGEWIQTRAERTETAEARAETAEAEAAQLREELARLKARR